MMWTHWLERLDDRCPGCAIEIKFVNLVSLDSTNYATWKIQCKMIRDGLWDIVNLMESVPDPRIEIALHAKYLSRRDRVETLLILLWCGKSRLSNFKRNNRRTS